MKLRRKTYYLMIVILIFIIIGADRASTTQLGELAGKMSKQSWAQLTTKGLTGALLDAGNGHHVMQYTEDAKWDPNSRQFMFIGQGHYAKLKHIVYDEKTNSWHEEAKPYWANGIGHGYDHNAINPATGCFYFHPFNTTEIYQYVGETKVWTRLPDLPETIVCCLGMEYFPGLGGLVLAGGGKVYFFNEVKNQWILLESGLEMGDYHNFAEYNPVNNVMLLGGGNNSHAIYRLDSVGTIARLNKAPIVLGISQSINTVDPVTGDFLIFGNGGKFYTYDIINDTWQLQDSKPPFGDPANTIASPISTYGVVMLLKYDANTPRVFLYKHRGLTGASTTLKVGPTHLYKKPSDAAVAAKDGDSVEIDAGTYPGDVAVWSQDNLILRGVGGRAHLKADGAHAQGKGIWVIQGHNTTVENIEFSNARVPDQNGAGIRQEGSGLTIRSCYFHHNENGILGHSQPGEVLIENSEFAYNGYGDGYTHNLYILNASRLTIRFCYIHHAKIGHNIKSRAQENFICYNRIMDESDGSSSYAIDLPDGGNSYIIGNFMQQGPRTENSTVLAYGAESMKNPGNELYVVNNTIVNDHDKGIFIYVNSAASRALLANNLFVGVGTVLSGAGEQRTNLVTHDAKFVNKAAFDYRLTKESPAVDAGSEPIIVNGVNLAPVYHYVHPNGYTDRVQVGTVDIGAYEYHETIIMDELVAFNGLVQDGKVVLNWTILDGNSYDVAILRKPNGGAYKKIGLVPATGNPTQPQSFIDDSVHTGMIYIYRLQLIDPNNSFFYSREIFVEIYAVTEFRFRDNYPNPFNVMTTIRFETTERSLLTLEVYDVMGRPVRTIFKDKNTEPGQYAIPFWAMDLPTGMYLVRLTRSKVQTLAHRIVLLR